MLKIINTSKKLLFYASHFIFDVYKKKSIIFYKVITL